MTGRLIIAIVSTIAEEAVIALGVLFGLPQIGVRIPVAGLIVLMVLWLFVSIIIYQVGSSALKQRPLELLPSVVGSKGEVVAALNPVGMVRVRGELWSARANEDIIAVGEKVEVLEQDGLKLLVKRSQ